MNKQAREVTKDDLIPAEEYAKNRKAFRKEIVSYKKDRRVSLGPYANFYFESYETMKAQIQEMLHIEKGGDCLLYTSPSPRDLSTSRMPSSA